jgi:hypothetical protein
MKKVGYMDDEIQEYIKKLEDVISKEWFTKGRYITEQK